MENARTLPRTAVGLSLVLAPVLLLASALIAPALESDEAAQIEVIAQHPTRWYWYTIALLAGSILLVPALLGIAAVVRERAARLGDIGGGLAGLGCVIAVGDVMSQLITWQMADPEADRGQMAALLKRFDQAPGAGIVFTVGGLAVLAGTVLLGIGLLRARLVPVWSAVGLGVAPIVNVAGFSAASNAVVAVSWAILLVAMAPIARAVLTGGAQLVPRTGVPMGTVPDTRA